MNEEPGLIEVGGLVFPAVEKLEAKIGLLVTERIDHENKASYIQAQIDRLIRIKNALDGSI